MIPGKNNNNTQEQIPTGQEKSKVGTFSIFSVESFIRRVIRNWYWSTASSWRKTQAAPSKAPSAWTTSGATATKQAKLPAK